MPLEVPAPERTLMGPLVTLTVTVSFEGCSGSEGCSGVLGVSGCPVQEPSAQSVSGQV